MNELALFAGTGGGILGGGGCLDGEQSAPLSVMPTPHKFWRNDKMMDFSKLSQFGLTCAVLTVDRGQELLTLYQAAFRAKTLAQQVKVQASTAHEAACGKNLHGLLAKYDPPTHSWKTAQCSLLEDLELSLQTWPRWGSMRNGACYLRPILAQTISESACGLWATPTTMDKLPPKSEQALTREATITRKGRSKPANLRDQVSNMHTWKAIADTPSGNWTTPTCSDVMTDKLKSTQQKPNSMHSVTLAQAVQYWPTPTVNMVSGGANHNSPQVLAGKHGINLEGAVLKAYETPTARMWKDNGKSPSEVNRNSETLAMQAGGSLNPNWVEWLMGWPIGWTDLKPLAMDKCHFAPQPPLNCSEKG